MVELCHLQNNSKSLYVFVSNSERDTQMQTAVIIAVRNIKANKFADLSI